MGLPRDLRPQSQAMAGKWCRGRVGALCDLLRSAPQHVPHASTASGERTMHRNSYSMHTRRRLLLLIHDAWMGFRISIAPPAPRSSSCELIVVGGRRRVVVVLDFIFNN